MFRMPPALSNSQITNPKMLQSHPPLAVFPTILLSFTHIKYSHMLPATQSLQTSSLIKHRLDTLHVFSIVSSSYTSLLTVSLLLVSVRGSLISFHRADHDLGAMQIRMSSKQREKVSEGVSTLNNFQQSTITCNSIMTNTSQKDASQ